MDSDIDLLWFVGILRFFSFILRPCVAGTAGRGLSLSYLSFTGQGTKASTAMSPVETREPCELAANNTNPFYRY